MKMTLTLRAITHCALAASIAVLPCAPVPAAAADYAPLDCAKAKTPSERTICSNYGLGQFEAQTATLYEWTTSLVAMGQRGDIQDAQRAFIARRDACKAKIPCLRGAYAERIEQLEKIMSRITEKGPF
jgi:uncharacterized protein